MGTEFIIGYMEHSVSKMDLELYITTSETASVDVRVTAPLFSKIILDSSFNVTDGFGKQLLFSNDLRLEGTEMSQKGILVQATHNIAIFGFNKEAYSNDGFLGIPTDVLGKEYYATCATPLKYYTLILVVGIYDNTSVQIRLANNEAIEVQYNNESYGKNGVLEVNMNRYWTFQVHSLEQGDLTGTYIRADKPVSVFSGNKETPVGYNAYDRPADHLVEMQIPVETWGKKFAISPIPERTSGDFYRFVASQKETTINVRGQENGRAFSDSVALNDTGSWAQRHYSSQLYVFVESDKPILVTQYVLSQYSHGDKESGDPAMMIIPPIEQYCSSYTFYAPPKVNNGRESYNHFFIFVINNTEKDGIKMDGKPLTQVDLYHNIPGTGLVVGTIMLEDGTHTCSHESTTSVLGGLLYGERKSESYAVPAGMRMAHINNVSIF